MTDKELKEKLDKIGYSALWLDYGVLTIKELNKQIKIFENSDDQNTEHYRYSTFKNFLKNHSVITEKQLNNYLSLIINDEDKTMATSAIIDIFNLVALTDNQFLIVCNTLISFGDWTKNIIQRQALLRELKKQKLNDELFEKALQFKDPIIHDFLLKNANIIQLEKLTFFGANKSIRNIATNKIKQTKNSI
ncbi:MAG: hypothetical protein WDA08_05840 [Weeksellaceae bacterium]